MKKQVKNEKKKWTSEMHAIELNGEARKNPNLNRTDSEYVHNILHKFRLRVPNFALSCMHFLNKPHIFFEIQFNQNFVQ